MKMMMIRSLVTSALLALAIAPLAACAAPEGGQENEENAGTTQQPLVARGGAGQLKPGIGASACKSDTCVSGPGNNCSDFDNACKAEAGCGVTTGGNPIAQVHTCVTIPPPPPAEINRGPGQLTAKEDREEEECVGASSCNQLISDCYAGGHNWTCTTYADDGQCILGDCQAAC